MITQFIPAVLTWVIAVVFTVGFIIDYHEIPPRVVAPILIGMYLAAIVVTLASVGM